MEKKIKRLETIDPDWLTGGLYELAEDLTEYVNDYKNYGWIDLEIKREYDNTTGKYQFVLYGRERNK